VGSSSLLHWLGWGSLSSVIKLAKEEGIRNRVTRGNRWISAATFGIKDGKVVWRKFPDHAGEVPNFEEIDSAFKRHQRKSSKL
jgi:hypothetical protein